MTQQPVQPIQPIQQPQFQPPQGGPAPQFSGPPPMRTEGRPPVRRWDRSKYVPKRKVCAFCKDKIKDIDYKNVNLIRPYISDRGKIEPRRKTGACAKHQRMVSSAIKRARHVAMLPYVPDHIRTTGGIGLRSS